MSTLCKVFLAAALAIGAASCTEDPTPVDIKVPAGDVTFDWNSTEAKTVTVEANYDWDFTLEDEHGICTVAKTEDGSGLLITPNINYASKAYTATITVNAGNKDVTGKKVITVSQGANAKTYLNFLDSELQGNENPVIIMESNADGDPIVKEIRLVTNNVLSIKASSDQNVEVPSKATLEGYDWFSYEVKTEVTDEGEVTVLVLTSEFNESTSEYRTVAIEVVSGNEDIDNDIITNRIGIVVMPDTPMIYINPETSDSAPLVIPYTGSTQTVTIASNVSYDEPSADLIIYGGIWDVKPTLSEVKTEGRIRTYELVCPPSSVANERTAHFPFAYKKADGNWLTASLNIRQEAAPSAAVTVEKDVIVLDNATTSSLVAVETSIPEFTTCKVDASWLKAEYDAEAGVVKLTAEAALEDQREAVVTVEAGKGDNYAFAKINVTQLGTKAVVVITPAEIQLNEKGDAVTVKVTTNQASWSVDASASSDFTLTVDDKASTITVAGTPLSSGNRAATYTVTAGEATATLTVTQSKAYKVGDPYMAVIDGKSVPVGIVYEVDADGIHGKAYSLTVKNGADRFYFYDEQYYNDHKWDYEHKWSLLPVEMSPRSDTDGWYNREEFMKWPDWYTEWNMISWVEDLAAAQGVAWYIPAIDELKALISHMSGGVEFVAGVDPVGLYNEIDGLNQDKVDAIRAGWENTRAVYRQYTHPEGSSYSDYYTEEQYVVFEEADARTASPWHDQYGYYPAGDDLASYIWGSSTAYEYQGTDQIKTVDFLSKYYDGDVAKYRQLVRRVGAVADASYGPFIDMGFTASIHPICKF